MDGTYQGSASMIQPPPGLSGTSINPLTVRAINEGAVLIDGQFNVSPVRLSNNDWWVFQGFNAKNGREGVIHAEPGADNIIVRRVVVWDAEIRFDSAPVHVVFSQNWLLEDVGIFGTGRKSMAFVHPPTNNNTCRRCWIRWEGNIHQGTMGVTTNYNSFGFTCENCLITWSGESQPESFEQTNDAGVGTGRFKSNFDTLQADVVFGMDGQRTVDKCTNAFVAGSLVYLLPSLVPGPVYGMGVHGLLAAGAQGSMASCVQYKHTFVYVSPSHAQASSIKAWNLINGTENPPYTNVTADRITSVRHASAGDNFHSPWVVTNQSVGTSLAAVANPWTSTSVGANLCKRWVNRVVTNEPLWPWPMNDRIKAATAAAGRYTGQCVNCVGGRRVRTATDVTATVESLLGPIPLHCRANP